MEPTPELKNTATPLVALPPTDRAYLVLSEKHNEQDLVELAGKYVDVTEIKDVTDYTLANRGRITLMKARTAIQSTAKAARDDANKFRQAVIDEEKRLIAIPEPEEKRLKALCKDYDDEQARIAEEARAVEQRRIADITERIQAIKRQVDGLLGSDSTAIQMRLDAVNTITCNESLFAEFAEQAAEVKAGTIKTLTTLLEAREDFEAQQAENERIAREQAEQQAKLDQQAKEQEAREQAAKDKIAAEQAEVDRQREAIEAERKAEQEEDEVKKLVALRAKAEQVRAKATAEGERIERERIDAEYEAEAARLEAIKPEKEKLREWAEYLAGMNGPDVSNDELKALRDATKNIIEQAAHYLMNELSREVQKP